LRTAVTNAVVRYGRSLEHVWLLCRGSQFLETVRLEAAKGAFNMDAERMDNV
jgi:hypothetical protein